MLSRLRELNPFSSNNRPFWKRKENTTMSSPAPIQNDTSYEEPVESVIADCSLPIHERRVPINPQNNCPFFNGRIPPEIRDEIFSYALSEMTPPVELDPTSAYPKDVARPGYTARRTIAIPFLQTCRRIYLETFHLPIINREHVFWHAPNRGPYGQRFTDIYDLAHEEWYFGLMMPWQLKLVKEIHLFTQMFWLEGSFKEIADKSYMTNVERLKITITRRDWWWNEKNVPLFIHPKRIVHSRLGAKEMLATIKLEKTAKQEGRELEPFMDNAWGAVFKKFPSLKELEFEFETSDDKKADLETIVDWAKTWKFPMSDGMVLSADDSVVQRSTWIGPRSFWGNRCPYCSSNSASCGRSPCVCSSQPACFRNLSDADKWNPGCVLRAQRIGKDKGPTLHVMSLCWKLAKDLEAVEESGLVVTVV
jgi:hypothetical protein